MTSIGRKIEVTGVILPSSWDTEGNITDVKIYAHGEKQYEISEGGKSAKLFKLLKETVQIVGNLTQTEQGKEAILVRKINKLKGDSSEIF